MNKEISKLWINALRSEKYEQGKGRLNSLNRFCCLGVLCELGVEAGICKKTISDTAETIYGDEEHYDGQILPKSVQNWAEMKSAHGALNTANTHLTTENDYGGSFIKIANLIEQHWEEL